jgi:outer membrane lipoprotein-sorting protein
MKLHKLLMTVLLVSLTPGAIAATPEETGLAIAVEADRRDTGFGDSIAAMSMILRNKQGDESRRELRVRTLEVEGDGDKGLSIFDKPADVKGTAFLTFTHKTGPDDQWLYLPSLKRVKRIASKNKSGPFMGSEFAYEDISSQEVDKYTYRYLRDEPCGELECFVIERVPVDPNSGYTRQVVWIDKQEYRPQKVDYYDRKNDPLKTLTFHEYRQYLDRYWRAMRQEMVNHQTGKSTTLLWEEYTFGHGLTDRDFDKNSLKRAK